MTNITIGKLFIRQVGLAAMSDADLAKRYSSIFGAFNQSLVGFRTVQSLVPVQKSEPTLLSRIFLPEKKNKYRLRENHLVDHTLDDVSVHAEALYLLREEMYEREMEVPQLRH